jgi:putative ABC transport system permease protein
MFTYNLKLISQFIDDMKRQKLRCFLTMSGITWGTMSVILLLSIGNSLRIKSLENMSGMGSNIVVLGSGRTALTYNGIPAGRAIQLGPDTADILARNIPEIGEISSEIQRTVSFVNGKNRQNYNCVGVIPQYSVMRKLIPEPGGRFIDPLDMAQRRRVVFIGTDIRDDLFGEKVNAAGKSVLINGIPYTVIGVMEKKTQNSSYMNQDREIAFIPFSTCLDMFGATTVNRIIIRARTVNVTPRMKDRIYQVLGTKMGFSVDDKDALWMWDTSESAQFLEYFFLGFQMFLLLGGIFTLIVGGIGVANIMYVAIRERRREIGIKSALGATPRLILTQFILESFIIMFLGGSAGVLGACFIVAIFNHPALSQMQAVMGHPAIDINTALITAGILALVGFAAGWSPAKSASDMDPVRALEF